MAKNTSSEVIWKKNSQGRKAPQYIAALAASFSAFSFGTAIGWTSQISPKLLNGELRFEINEGQLGWIGGLVMLGASILALFIGPICDLIGRKTTMLGLIAPLTLGWCLICWATNVEMMYAGRFFTGMVGGAFCVTAPMYCNEISQKEIRGTLGCFTQLMITAGILFDVVLSKFVSIQRFTICCLSAPILFGIIFAFMPESPVYFLKKKRLDEAKHSLKRLRGDQFDIEGEILEINAMIVKSESINVVQVLLASFKRPETRRAFIICMGLMSFRVFGGMDAITAYTSYIFQSVSDDLDPEVGTIILISMQAVAGICQSFVVDRLGRRSLLLTSESAMALCVIAVGLCVFLKERENVYVGFIPLVALCIFYVGYSLGLGPISFMMTSEVLPKDINSLIVSFSTFVSFMLSFVVAKTFFIMKEGWGADVTFFIYGGLTIVGSIFIYFLVPETKGKSYDEIQTLLGSRRKT